MGELIYRGTGIPHDGIELLPPPPPWRDFGSGWELQVPSYGVDYRPGSRKPNPGEVYRPSPQAVDMVNAALLLRRPLLVIGPPGTGKSSLAYNIAYELSLGPVLYWPINRGSTLAQGLYDYDAVGRMQEASLRGPADPSEEIGRYIRLGPTGTALLPWRVPRVLLIDDLDKSDIDLPGDLLTVFEQGEFEIPPLARLDARESQVLTSDPGQWASVREGRVRCTHFPMVVMTSNGEREFPAQFLRRCVRLELDPPDSGQLAGIVAAHLGEDLASQSKDLIAHVASLDSRPAIDQLLNAIYLAHSGLGTSADGERIREALLRAVEEDDWA